MADAKPEAPSYFAVTDPDIDAPDGAVVFIEKYQAWYCRSDLQWNKVEPEAGVLPNV